MFFTTVNSQCSLQIMLQNVPISESLACTLHLCYLQMVGTPWDIGGRRPGAGLGGSHPEGLGATGVEPGGHQHLSSRHLLHQEGGHHLLLISSSLTFALFASNSCLMPLALQNKSCPQLPRLIQPITRYYQILRHKKSRFF